jgi:hypothetical protein
MKTKDPRSNTFEGWIAALTILAKYQKKGLQERLFAGADHDVVWFTDKPAPKETEYTQEQLDANEPPANDDEENPIWPDETKADAAALIGLGFHWDTELNCWAKFV